MKPDARTDYCPDPDHARRLIARAAAVAGSRMKLANLAGISRRRLAYIEAGDRRHGSVRLQVRMTFAEQVVLEAIADGR